MVDMDKDNNNSVSLKDQVDIVEAKFATTGNVPSGPETMAKIDQNDNQQLKKDENLTEVDLTEQKSLASSSPDTKLHVTGSRFSEIKQSADEYDASQDNKKHLIKENKILQELEDQGATSVPTITEVSLTSEKSEVDCRTSVSNDSNSHSKSLSIINYKNRYDGEPSEFWNLCLSFVNSEYADTSQNQTTDSILKHLVTEDLSSIKSIEALKIFFTDGLYVLPPKLISETLSVLIAIAKKSVLHLELARGLLSSCVNHLSSKNSRFAIIQNGQESKLDNSNTASNVSLAKHFLREWVNLLIAHSCDVQELKLIIKMSENDPSLLEFVKQANLLQRSRPHAFFAFPGTKGSLMSLPPFQKWPIQLGWSFSTWFFLDPKPCAQPYLYNFKTGKSGLGYSAHFTGNCLVLTSIRVKGKGVQHCVAYEFPSYKWIHCAITYHNEWRASEIKVYVNGQLIANIDIPWQVQTGETFDKCFIGGSGSITGHGGIGDLNCFCGQMSAVYLFNEGLSAAQICALHRLGPSYMGQFKYSNESLVNLPVQICKTLYEEKLASSLFSLFTPVAVDSGTLCIQLAPFKSSTSASAQNYFKSAPHAALQGGTRAIITQPICYTLQSLGCFKSLLPLLEVYSQDANSNACESLIGFICDLLESSPHWFTNEIVQNNVLVIVIQGLSSNARVLLTEKLLKIFLNLTRTLLTTATSPCDSMLLKHLIENILLNPSLWIYAEAKVQIKLYNYLATEFLPGIRHGVNRYTMSSSGSSQPYLAYTPTSQAAMATYSQTSRNEEQSKSTHCRGFTPIVAELLFAEIRRVSTVLQSLHALKYYYWIDEDNNINYKARDIKLRPDRDSLILIRRYILQFTKELIMRSNTAPLDEVQGLLNYLSACSKPNNILDVIDMISELISEHQSNLVVALDQKQAIKVIFGLIDSSSEIVCVRALRLLSQFLSHCSYKKKQDIMGPNNLFMLLCDRLRQHQPLSLAIYEALIDLLLEEHQSKRALDDDRAKELAKKTIVNSTVIKVIATLLHEEYSIKHGCAHASYAINDLTLNDGVNIRSIFINDLWNLIVNIQENRRTILQMSVWQHWLINLINSTIDESPLIRDQILAIFRVLLYHAIRYEYSGWRVWTDTLAILHAKVSYDEFYNQIKRDSSCGSSSESVNKQPTHECKLRWTPDDKRLVGCDLDKGTIKDSDSIRMCTADDEQIKKDIKQAVVSSISEHIVNQSRGIDLAEDDDGAQDNEKDLDEKTTALETDTKTTLKTNKHLNDDELDCQASLNVDSDKTNYDSVDIAPSRAYRRASIEAQPQQANNVEQQSKIELKKEPSLTSIALDTDHSLSSPVAVDKNHDENEDKIKGRISVDSDIENRSPIHQSIANHASSNKTKVSPAFRIPEFRWNAMLIKLVNDLIFSVECDLYQWRCSAKLSNIDAVPFTPKNVSSVTGQNSSSLASGATSSAPKSQIELVLRKPENQVYIINVVHLVSQLADNVITAAGGLLSLLSDATRLTKVQRSVTSKTSCTREGLTELQANSLLYRLVSIVDMVVFASSHVDLNELEVEKNVANGCILRQCLRLACTVAVKNTIVLQSLINKNGSSINSKPIMTMVDFPKDMFDSYHGCSLLSANGLFEQSALKLEDTDLIASLEYSPHQNPNTSSMPSILPFQTNPIRDPNKLIQTIDLQRIQACIYHNGSTELRQSQFLALATLYFLSVQMVSTYRDIVAPKNPSQQRQKASASNSNPKTPPVSQSSSDNKSSDGQAISSIEANLLSFGKMQPNNSNRQQQPVATSGNSLTDILTNELETTLDTSCQLLKTIICDFCSFLSKALIGTHGQDLINKEADRTFRRSDTSPVEIVMLLCSQEWQGTLQNNAGLAFAELNNEGIILSDGMKDNIARVAMEADFILSRLRADDVAKHEHFILSCSESLSARLHEEVLINSLISSAARRDCALYTKFKEMLRNESKQNYKLDIWEDDDRRRRRYVFDSWDDSTQIMYSIKTDSSYRKVVPTLSVGASIELKADTKQRILDLQRSIENGGIDEHCSPAGHKCESVSHGDDNNDDDDEDDSVDISENGEQEGDSISECEHENVRTKEANANFSNTAEIEKRSNVDALNQLNNKLPTSRATSGDDRANMEHLEFESTGELKSNNEQLWDHEDCNSVADFTSSVIFAAEVSLIWGIYAIPGVLQITSYELHFEPNQNISEAIDALKRGADEGDLKDTIESNSHQKSTNNEQITCRDYLTSERMDHQSYNEHQRNNHHQQRIPLRKLDLMALRYCDFLTSNCKLSLMDIRAIFSRHYLLQPNALEIFLSQRTSVMFAFADFDIVKRVIKYLPAVGVGIKYGIAQSRRASLMSPRQLFAASNMTQRWQKREIGNFQYLMFLNTIAGRTYQDLNQYPVFPWILTDYESEELDLNSPKNFRDLSKPIGALNNKRRNEFIERYQTWDNPKVPAFHYGTHYSTAAFTLNWLCRLRGIYNSSYLALQDGKYEENSRLFLSISDSWINSLSGNQQNVKELIPEFFYLPEMFHANLGLAEVEYPPWAKTAEEFVRMHRIALESELVSCQLHQWIDLIFGYKQRGPEAVSAVNTFYYLTYQGNVNLGMIQDNALREAIETQIKHFGQTPSQLSTEPHPPRFSALHASPLTYSPSLDEVTEVIDFPSNNPVVHISSCIKNYITTSSGTMVEHQHSVGSAVGTTNQQSSVLTITSNNQYQIHQWVPDDQAAKPMIMDPQLQSHSGSSSGSARRQLIDVDDLYSGVYLKLASQQTILPEPGSQQLQQDQLNILSSRQQSDIVDEVQWPCAHHIVTLNGKYIIMGSFYDNSFRVFTTESGKLCQVIYGHQGPITCIARSEGNALADFYIATGGQDCALLIWMWNERYAQVVGSGVSAVLNPTPKLSISGHQTAVLSALICSELGLIVSGSKNLVLVHTTATGENLIHINMQLPDVMERTLKESKLLHEQSSCSQTSIVHRPRVQDKHKTILEASMLSGSSPHDSRSSASMSLQRSTNETSLTKSGSSSRCDSPIRRAKEEKFLQLKDLCCSDYYITGLQFARELAFLICIALPPPMKKVRHSSATECDQEATLAKRSPALLVNFNLKGSLMDICPIGQSSISSPKLGDVCILQVSRDGEFLILNDSPITIKIYKTFGLQPLFAYNTNDIPQTLPDAQNRIRSLSLLDHKYILVGLDNGKIIVYNCDFKNL